MSTQKTYADIEKRAFRLFNFDIEILRNIYRRLQTDLPRAFIFQMKRKPLIDSILAAEFGGDFFVQHKKQCAEWDKMENEADSIPH